MLNLLRKHQVFDNLVTASLSKFHLVKKACNIMTTSDDACLFLKTVMKNVSFYTSIVVLAAHFL
jgi:hypothetical protein